MLVHLCNGASQRNGEVNNMKILYTFPLNLLASFHFRPRYLCVLEGLRDSSQSSDEYIHFYSGDLSRYLPQPRREYKYHKSH